MKKTYWFVLIYLAWCLVGALWYLFSVKNLTTDPKQFDATAMLVGIVEILVMMLVAFIIGFGLAWYLQQDALQLVNEQKWDAEYTIESRDHEITAVRHDHDALLQKLLRVEETLNTVLLEKEKFMQQYADAAKEAERWQKQYREQDLKVQHLDGEVASAKFRTRLLENDVTEKDKSIAKLKEDLKAAQSLPTATHRDWSDHPFVRPIEPDGEAEKDDLTQIKGIGPKFMQKLNSLDIFSFRQISELSGEEVERLAEVIEVFPDRIHRDNWIGQATKLHLKKMEVK
jgi:predicted flap endonuclease-1-like 5' DNA nuclease